MIQRIQTLFLALAALAIGLLFAMPYVEVQKDDYFVQEYTPMMIFAGILIVGYLATIFLFKNRPLQLRITRILTIFLVALVGYAVYQLYQVNFKELVFEPGGLLPLFAGYFGSRAASKINADEKLVKSVDRLR